MKKELNELLASESACLKINDMFVLKRRKGTNFLGIQYDTLMLEMVNCSGKLARSEKIESRDISGIINEVNCYMGDMMKEYTSDLQRHWKAGYLWNESVNQLPNLTM